MIMHVTGLFKLYLSINHSHNMHTISVAPTNKRSKIVEYFSAENCNV